MKRYVFTYITAVLLAVGCIAYCGAAEGQTKIHGAFSSVSGDTDALSWIVNGSTRYSQETRYILFGRYIYDGRIDAEARVSLGQTRQDASGEYVESVDRVTAEALYSIECNDLNLFTATHLTSEVTADSVSGSDYTARLSAGVERRVSLGGLVLAGRFGPAVENERYMDETQNELGVESAVELRTPVGRYSDLTVKVNTFRGRGGFTMHNHNNLTARLIGLLAATVDVNLIKQRDRDWHTEFQVGLGFAF